MWKIHLWIICVLPAQFGRGGSDCPEDLLITPYSGTVSVTNNGHTCQAWSSQTPHEHFVNDSLYFPDDGSVTAAKNYCRNVWENTRPWCFTTHPDIRFGYCDFAICTDNYRECGEVLQSAAGSITAPDFDGDGLYDINIDCLWTVQAPKNYVIRYVIQFVEIEMEGSTCIMDLLLERFVDISFITFKEIAIFEKGRSEGLVYCGTSGTYQVEGETLSNILYVQFYSDYSVTYKGFNITFRQLKARNTNCGEVLTDISGWIASPDLDEDGHYDFNLNCTWIIEVDENNAIEFRLLYMDIMPSEDCFGDRLLIYDTKQHFIWFCDFVLSSETDVMNTISNVLFVHFVSDNINSRAGFKLKYVQASRRCLDDLTGYNGTVSVTNHGQTCQAWSSQTPHQHSYNQDNLFPLDSSVVEASNYCRDIDNPGRPWCYTVEPTIMWSYCTFSICNSITGLCGGLIQNKTGVISSREPYVPYELKEADCLWTIQAGANNVIKYHLLIDEALNHDQCQAHALIFFEKGGPLHGRTFCDSLYLYLNGETRSNILHIRYYKERNTDPINFYCMFEHMEAQPKIRTETLRNQSGWIISPDRDGDHFYDFNVKYQWTIKGNSSSTILLKPVYIMIESSPDCSNDYILISDNYGQICILCGVRNDTEADVEESRSNHLYIDFHTNEIISARGFNFSYEIHAVDDDCLINLLQNEYSGTVSVTNHGITCQSWISQTPHRHTIEYVSFEAVNYCRKFDSLAPWCITMDPYIRWQYCTYSICNGTYQKCQEVLRSSTGFIVSPDYDKDGLYDLNVDCLWMVEAPNGHVIQFHLLFVNIESTSHCVKDLLLIFEKKYGVDVRYICGHLDDGKVGETQTNLLYVQFYSDNSIQDRGFNISYEQLEALIQDKICMETFRTRSGWITSPDKDGDGFYDFNVNCIWTVEVDPSKLIQFQLMYVDLDEYLMPQNECMTDKIMIYDDIGELTVMCGVKDQMSPTEIRETRSNVMSVWFTSNNIDSGRGFNLTYAEFERNTDCFDDLKSNPYSGTVSVTNNGLPCQAWSDQTPHNHSENKDTLFPIDGSVSKAKNYCRDIWGDGRPWCYTKDKDIRMGFCTLRICKDNIQTCGDMLSSPNGSIVPPDSNNNVFYDLNVDCLWIIEAAEHKVIRHRIDQYFIEDSSGCHKDALRIYERGDDIWSIFCGLRMEQLEGETLSNRLYVHFYSDESVASNGFRLTFVQKEVSILPCSGALNPTRGWLAAPDRDGDGLYDFNVNCLWTVDVQSPSMIHFVVPYVMLDPCDDDSDYLEIYQEGQIHLLAVCGSYLEEATGNAYQKLYIHFVSNNLDVGSGFILFYKQRTVSYFTYQVTGDGWIRPPELTKDKPYNILAKCKWLIKAPEKDVIAIDIYFARSTVSEEGLCIRKYLSVSFRGYGFENFCGIIGRQATIQSYVNHAFIHFKSIFYESGEKDADFLLAYNHTKDLKKSFLRSVRCPGWISSFDDDLNGQYNYHTNLHWIIMTDDTYNYILLKLLYIDVEESRGCVNDYLEITSFLDIYGKLCGIGFKKVITVLSPIAIIHFNSDYTINRFGFNMSFLEITGVLNYNCDVVLTGPSGYLTSIDANMDGRYDNGQNCTWTIMLEYTNVILFEVLKQDIPQSEEYSTCENDFLEIYEDHRDIGKYCGNIKAPHFTTEANILYVRFTTSQFLSSQFLSGQGFEAVYFQGKDVKDCAPDYKCLLTDRSIQPDFICDSYNDCPHGDDERFCNFRCPLGCICTGLSVDCTGRYECGFNRKPASFVNQTFALSSITRTLDISSRHDMFLYLDLERQDLGFLTHLNLSTCNITHLSAATFQSMKRLKVLDLSFNKIRHLKTKLFLNQTHLELFLFRGNLEPLIIEPEAFVGLVSLRYLDLSTLHIERISKGSFSTLHLKSLKIYHSHIVQLESASLDKLYVEGIYLNSSTIETLTETMFHGGTGINTFVTDEYKFCCVRPLFVQERNCYPQKDEFSSCDDLIKNRILRPLILIIGLFALLSNASSVIYRLKYHAEQLKFCYGIAVLHLAGSDFLLGIYLIMIGITDNIFRGTYIFHDESWRSSAWCNLAGVLSTVSCEVSVLFSCLITVDRLLVIKYPFGQKRLTGRNGTVLAIVFWGTALFLAILPVFLPSYFKGEFYARSGLCLALPLTRVRSSSWGYAFGIFIVFNSLACLLIAVGQWIIYKEIKTSKKAVGDRRSKSSKDSRINRNLLLVVTTNFLCWLPVGFIGVMALADYPIPVNIYSWIAVVVLPINSAVNPILYTLSEMLQRKKKVPFTPDTKLKMCMLTADDLDRCTDLWKSSAFWSFKGQSAGFTSLTEILKEEWFCRKQRVCVAIDTCKLLQELHDRKITQEDLTIDDVFIKKTSQRCKVVLLCRPQEMLKVTDQDDNIMSLGLVLSALITEA